MRSKQNKSLELLEEPSSGANLSSSRTAATARKDQSIELSQLVPQAQVGVSTNKTSQDARHTPFVLAFESSVLAEQLTIVEKDALDEISWKDLVELKWQQRPQKTTNWVEYLQHVEETPYTNGIDIAITRFNLAVKWVVSEVVLTSTLHERALCITKFIHTAVHTLRMRNFASTYQITLALLSTDLARLKGTWALVPSAEKGMLGRLEKLCQPMRNFANLRTEMERGDVAEEEGTGTGCIPFIGLFTHDLVFNAEKPSTISPSRQEGKNVDNAETEALVNFERYQTAATIVKGLLRLLEKSSRYVFHPHPEALSRCLWLAALEDAEISARSRMLEKKGE
ncbi:ras GEF [Polychaeton citri CBS 116435]|uniref:Ras GEF n=1 Tax=Polychaeton citri CBS 116435 TaxID=1314669 RepID=A0A9P4UQ57_9PEZI|nr:ras GEF [Polychaeton citri CBS 116435]